MMEIFSASKGEDEIVIGLAGNPNVGKSTVFNALTGLSQHTGNWSGKTVSNACGAYRYKDEVYTLVDMPGTYSLFSSSVEEEVARDYICFGNSDAVCIVADATCLERNLNLILQISEVKPNTILCVNLADEAEKKHIKIDFERLSSLLKIPVVKASARSGVGLDELREKIRGAVHSPRRDVYSVRYDDVIEAAVATIQQDIELICGKSINPRWLALRILEKDEGFNASLLEHLGFDIMNDEFFCRSLSAANTILTSGGYSTQRVRDSIVASLVHESEYIYGECVVAESTCNARDRRLDRILTSKLTGIPVMLLLMVVIFWITICGANYPSQLLYSLFFSAERYLYSFMSFAPEWVSGIVVDGIYRVLAWVVSVMLPPMAIFFPLFTLLEDLGYLPRIAFNMDSFFKRAHAHGKQALTMCMGFGCNACGVTGCRIIDSPRERLIAVLTNSLVPCNGRFPTLISIITMFFAGAAAIGFAQSLVSTLILVGVIVFSVAVTLAVSHLLSKTLLKGAPSSFILELPPYRVPQIGRVIVRSMLDRSLFVLGRAVCVAAPAGAIIWLMANTYIADSSLLAHCSAFLDPFARTLGLDGVILMAFILGFPANEIVMPIIIMGYMAGGTITEAESTAALHSLLVNNGWTAVTAICTMLFSLMHWPCATTCLTIKKETGSLGWCLAAMLIPTLFGILLCFTVATVARLFGF